MRLYDVRETAALLSVSPSTVRRLVKRRELPVVRIGFSLRISDRGALVKSCGISSREDR
jgi:excisionase family DNA binding protein